MKVGTLKVPGTMAEANPQPCYRDISVAQCAWESHGIWRENKSTEDQLVIRSCTYHKEVIHHESYTHNRHKIANPKN